MFTYKDRVWGYREMGAGVWGLEPMYKDWSLGSGACVRIGLERWKMRKGSLTHR